MKRQNKKLLTVLLAGAMLTAATGVATLGNNLTASAEAKAYAYTDVFKTSGSATIAANESDATKLSVSFPDGGSVNLSKRDLALKWYESETPSYFNFDFAIEDTNFQTIEIKIQTASAWATEDEVAENVVTFQNANGGVTVKVNDGDESDVGDITALSLTLAADAEEDYGEYAVKLGGAQIGTFTNVGAAFAENTSDITPFTIKAELPDGSADDAKTVVTLKEINGQSLALNADGKINDTASPVLIVEEELNGFMLGTQYAVSTEVVDVLDTSPSSSSTYYQFSPDTIDYLTGDKKDEDGKEVDVYKTMPATKPYLQETVYGENKDLTVYENWSKDNKGYNAEFLSVKFKLNDDVTENSTEVQLAWYVGRSEKIEGVPFMIVDRSESGAYYTCVTKDDANKENVLDETNEGYLSFVQAVKDLTEETDKDGNVTLKLKSGSTSYFYVPSLKGLIEDDNGYSNLKFTICYKNSSGTKTSSNLSASSLKFALTVSGEYEFRILANDKAGNTMKYYVDGEEVAITSSNIWSVEGYPTFRFQVAKTDLSIEDESSSDRKTTQTLDKTYTLSDITVLGDAASSCTKTFALFKVNVSAFDGLNRSDLYGVSYSSIQAKATKAGLQAANGNYLAYYKELYLECLASNIGVSAEDLKNCKDLFVEIAEFDSRIDKEDHAAEWNKNNKYNWDASDASFKTVEEGVYFILGVYSDPDVATNKATAYKVVIAEEKEDVIKGETNWFKNNVVSVVLFSIAGVMLVLLLILLMVNPSDETLEDVSKDAAAKKDKKSKK